MLMMVTRDDARLAEKVDAAVRGGVNIVRVREGDAVAVCDVVADRACVVSAPVVYRRLPAGPGRTGGRLEGGGTRGVHLRESEPFVPAAPFVGRSVHSLERALAAQAEGCHYLLAGTIFPSASHPGGAVGGIELIEEIAKNVDIPIIAIGGITPHNAKQCLDAGAAGVAVLSYLMDAPDAEAAARALIAACN